MRTAWTSAGRACAAIAPTATSFLAWGDVRDDGTLRLIRGSKLKFAGVAPSLVEEAMRPGHRLVARIRLTGAQGESALTWSPEPADAEPG